jgi:hypothetical protein
MAKMISGNVRKVTVAPQHKRIRHNGSFTSIPKFVRYRLAGQNRFG